MDPGHYFAGMERFGDVVVGAKIEAVDPIVFGGTRREHHNRHSGFLPQPLADLVTGDARNHEVENHEGDIFAGCHFEAIDAIASHRRFVSGMLEVHLERVRHDCIVFNDHNPQAIPFSSYWESARTNDLPTSSAAGGSRLLSTTTVHGPLCSRIE